MIRDKRLDTIGCIGFLNKELVEDVKDRPGLRSLVKAAMSEKKEENAAGDLYEGLLVPPGEKTVIDPAKFIKLWDGMEISRKDFLACISVRTKEAKELLSASQLKRVSDTEPTEPSLRVSLIKDIVIDKKAAASAIVAAVCGKL